MYSDEETDETLYVNEKEKYKNCYDNALRLLQTNIEEYTNNNNSGIVNIVPYSINKRGKYPFIEFILNKSSEFYKNEPFNDLKFYQFFYMNELDIFEYSNKVLNVSFSHILKDGSVDFSKYYKGYVNENHNIYLFYDCTEINKDSTVTNLYNMWITLSEEIYKKKSCNVLIHNDVVDFFTRNCSFLYLTNKDGSLYELPDVGYTGSTFKKAEFRSVFSNMASSIDEIFGPYYYFTNFEHAIKDAKEEKSRNDTSIINYGGLNRYALFKGKSISFYDFSSEDIEVGENNSEKDWTVNNDSIYIENLMALKKYEQHVPISYHLV